MHSKRAFAIGALCFVGASSLTPAVAQDEVFVAQDGLNTGTIGAYDVSFGSDSASGSTVNSDLITTPPAGASTEVRVSLATDGLGDLFVGEWATGSTTATIGEYSLNGTVINSSLLTLSDSSGVPQLVADSEGQLFVALGGTVSEYTTGGTLLNSFKVGPVGGEEVNISALALDSSDDLYLAFSVGLITLDYTDNGVVSEYTASGSPIKKSLISTPNLINGLAVGGGNILVSISDGPPDILARIDEYTTGGTLVTQGFIANSGRLALDGQGHLLVSDYGVGTVGAYTTSGGLLNSTAISGVVGAEDILAIPVPEPSAPGLLAVGAMGIFLRAGSRWSRNTGATRLVSTL